MLYPHSLLWHYLWRGPAVLLALALISWRKGLYRVFPSFFAYFLFEGIQNLTLWLLDIAPGITPGVYWLSLNVGLVIECFVKLFVVWELFSHLVRGQPKKARLGTRLILCAGAMLLLLAVIASLHAHIGEFAVMGYAQAFQQAIFIVETGLLLFIFLFAAYFHLPWERLGFGFAVGLSIFSCVGLAVFAIYANAIGSQRHVLLEFFSGIVYHGCVLMWLWYILSSPTIAGSVRTKREASSANGESVLAQAGTF